MTYRRREIVHLLSGGKALCGHGARGGPEPKAGTTDKEQVSCVSCRRLLKDNKQ